jgi:hypothetical protein
VAFIVQVAATAWVSKDSLTRFPKAPSQKWRLAMAGGWSLAG